MVRNHYLLLGIPPEASQQQIKTAYRSLAKRLHPDRNGGSETAAELFRQINEAYRVLSNPKTRAKYDRKLAARQATATETKNDRPAGEDPRRKFSRFLNNLLDALFGAAEKTEQTPPATASQQRPQPRKKEKPAFNFYYHLAVEKESSPYRRGDDGVYRKNPESGKKS